MFPEKATKDLTLLSNVKIKWDITQKFCGLLRKPEFYENVKMRLHKDFGNFVLFWSAKKYVCARRGFRVRAPFPPIDMSKTFLGWFSCLRASWLDFSPILFDSFFFLILSTTNFYNLLTISVFNHDFSHLLSLKVS